MVVRQVSMVDVPCPMITPVNYSEDDNYHSIPSSPVAQHRQGLLIRKVEFPLIACWFLIERNKAGVITVSHDLRMNLSRSQTV